MKLMTIASFGVGYVLGTKAGRERYERILEAALQASQRLEAYSSGGSFAKDRGAGAHPRVDGGSGHE